MYAAIWWPGENITMCAVTGSQVRILQQIYSIYIWSCSLVAMWGYYCLLLYVLLFSEQEQDEFRHIKLEDIKLFIPSSSFWYEWRCGLGFSLTPGTLVECSPLMAVWGLIQLFPSFFYLCIHWMLPSISLSASSSLCLTAHLTLHKESFPAAFFSGSWNKCSIESNYSAHSLAFFRFSRLIFEWKCVWYFKCPPPNITSCS